MSNNNDEFAITLHNIASRKPGYQDYNIISSSKLHEAARRLQILAVTLRGLCNDILNDPDTAKILKEEAREILKEIV